MRKNPVKSAGLNLDLIIVVYLFLIIYILSTDYYKLY